MSRAEELLGERHFVDAALIPDRFRFIVGEAIDAIDNGFKDVDLKGIKSGDVIVDSKVKSGIEKTFKLRDELSKVYKSIPPSKK